MMNIRNLGLEESVKVKYKDGICAELCLKLWFKSAWYFCNIESGWFWKRLSRNKVPKNHFVKVQKQRYAYSFQNRCSWNFRNRKTPVLESLFNKVAGLKVCNFMKKRLQQNTPGGCFCQFDKVTVQYRVCTDLLSFIKNTMWDGFH